MLVLIGTPLTFNANISGNAVYGNSEASLIGGKVSLVRDVYPWEYEVSLSAAYGSAKVGDSSEITSNNGIALVRMDRYLVPRFEVFAFGSSEYNRVMGLENRSQGGIGAKYVLFKADAHKFSVSAALLGGYERFVGDTTSRYPIRLSIRPKGRFDFARWGALSFVLFYQPNVREFRSDYRVFGDIVYSLAFTEMVAFNLVFKYNYDGYVASKSGDPDSKLYGVKPYEFNLLLGLTLKVPLER